MFGKAPDRAWLPFLKMLFGIILLVSIVSLAGVIALGQVQQNTSHGLDTLLGGLLAMSGGFAHWAFTSEQKEKDEKPNS